MGIAAYRNSKDIFNIFIFQLFFNMIWSWLFFYFQMTVVALIDIAVLIILNLIILFTLKNIDKLSFMIYVPYVAWLFFAGYLNTYIVLYN
jgi:tryptophan-rich sensory protein